jgi:hypothetical protein
VPGVVGPPLPFVAVTREASGRLALRGPQVAAPGGQMTTQDLGEVGPKGQVSVFGRADRVVISGGRNIDPAAVERVLLRHPAVAQAVVCGIPDRHLGASLAAAIAPRDEPARRDLGHFAAAALHRYDRPRLWGLVRAIPTTAAGKVSAATRDSLRARLVAALAGDSDPQRLEAADEVGGRGDRAEAGDVDERVYVLDLGVEDVVGPLDGEADAEAAAAAAFGDADGDEADPQAVAEAGRAAEVGVGVDHRQAPAVGLHRREPPAEGGAQELLPGVVAPLEEAAIEGDTGGVDLRESDDMGVGLEHHGDHRPPARPGQAGVDDD